MREEKKLLVHEAVAHLGKSRHTYVVGFSHLTVGDVFALRKLLREKGAEYHVVKNSVLGHALREGGWPKLNPTALCGPTAIVTGGQDASAVAKVLCEFAGEKGREGKLTVKGGALDGKALAAADVTTLSQLPPLDELRARLLALLQASAQNLLRLCQAAAQSFFGILQAYARKTVEESN
ncbi:MAG: 50S ribosomal protein L10 [Puniceicoccales bacterium]|nr:50S ribosomal protein L10 [Puniceicoccales bacterium]